MRHFIEHVLPEADLTWISPNLQQEEEHAAEKVTHGLGTNNFLMTNQTCFSTRTVPVQGQKAENEEVAAFRLGNV